MNFKRYNESDNSWTDSHYIKKTDTDTITTLPAIIYPLAQTATIGLKGNTVQNGTPTPDNPVMPQGTGEKTANLLDENTSSDADATHINYNKSAPIILTAGQTYTFSCDMTCNGLYIRSAADDSNLASANNSSTLTYTPQVNVSAYCRVWNSNGITNLKPMLNTGSTALPYEPYGYKIPISSANTTTPVYLGEVETTRKIKKLVLTGQEGWVRTANQRCYYINASTGCPTNYLKQRIITSICSHYQSQNNTSGSNEVKAGHFCFYTGSAFELYIGETTISSVADFKSYVQQQYANGTPVTIWYVLATEETGIVNEPLRKIGDYADEVSGITIPTIAGANTLSVDTTLQPSEVTANYKGWHPVADVHKRERGAWT